MSAPRLILAWRGDEENANIHWADNDGSGWSLDRALGDRASLLGPSLCVYGDRLFMAWRGISGDHLIYWSTFDGTGWTPQRSHPGIASYRRPVLAAFDGALVMAWRSASDTDDFLWFCSFDVGANDWGPPQSAAALLGSRTSPALAAFRGRLYMAWCPPGSVNIAWASYDGHAWSARAILGDRASHDGPAFVVAAGALTMIWRGAILDTSDKHLYWSVLDPASGTWSPQQQIDPPQPRPEPVPPDSAAWIASRVRPGVAVWRRKRFETDLVYACVGLHYLSPGGGTPDPPAGDPTGTGGDTENDPGQDGEPPDLRMFSATAGQGRTPDPVPDWMTLVHDAGGSELRSGAEPALAAFAPAHGSLRTFLDVRGADPSDGLRAFTRDYWPGAPGARRLLGA